MNTLLKYLLPFGSWDNPYRRHYINLLEPLSSIFKYLYDKTGVVILLKIAGKIYEHRLRYFMEDVQKISLR